MVVLGASFASWQAAGAPDVRVPRGEDVVNEGFAGSVHQGRKILFAQGAGEDVVVEIGQGDHRQDVAVLDVHDHRGRVVAFGGVLLQRLLYHLLEVEVEGEHEVGAVQGAPLRED